MTLGFWCYHVAFWVVECILALVTIHLFLQLVQAVFASCSNSCSGCLCQGSSLGWPIAVAVLRICSWSALQDTVCVAGSHWGLWYGWVWRWRRICRLQDLIDGGGDWGPKLACWPAREAEAGWEGPAVLPWSLQPGDWAVQLSYLVVCSVQSQSVCGVSSEVASVIFKTKFIWKIYLVEVLQFLEKFSDVKK